MLDCLGDKMENGGISVEDVTGDLQCSNRGGHAYKKTQREEALIKIQRNRKRSLLRALIESSTIDLSLWRNLSIIYLAPRILPLAKMEYIIRC